MMKVALILALVAGTLAMPRLVPKQLGRIVGGEAADKSEFPYGVSVQNYFFSWISIFGGAIYDETRILTSAMYCADLNSNPEYARIVAGGDQVRFIETVQIHPDFHKDNNYDVYTNDICILTLSTPLVFDSWIQPIRLAEPSSVPSGSVVASSYGAADDGDLAGKISKATLNIMENSRCNEIYQKGNSNPCNTNPLHPGIHNTSLCAVGEGIDFLLGDTGSPLVAWDNETHMYLVGIASWSTFKVYPDTYPNVYSNIAALRGWLDSALSQ